MGVRSLVDSPGKPFSAVQVRGTCPMIAHQARTRFSVSATGVRDGSLKVILSENTGFPGKLVVSNNAYSLNLTS
jgi:hypothetical protein